MYKAERKKMIYKKVYTEKIIQIYEKHIKFIQILYCINIV